MNDSDRYTTVLLRHKKLIWRLCRRYAKHDVDLCSDLVQEVSIVLWEHFGRLKPEAGTLVETRWVMTNTRWVLRNMHRNKKDKEQLLADDMIDLRDDGGNARDLVSDLLSALPEGDRVMMQMKLDGYNADEIAGRMGLSRNAVYQRLFRIVNKLRRINDEQ